MGNEPLTMCWDSDINWSRLEDQFHEMEEIRPVLRVESICEEHFDEPGIAGWPSLPVDVQPFTPGPAVSLYDPACHSIRSKTRPRSTSNKITGDK